MFSHPPPLSALVCSKKCFFSATSDNVIFRKLYQRSLTCFNEVHGILLTCFYSLDLFVCHKLLHPKLNVTHAIVN